MMDLAERGIALGDRARASTNTTRAKTLWLEACDKYRAAVACDVAQTQSTQALNNWGLALQQVAMLTLSQDEKTARLSAAVQRFREAIRRDPGFHRAVYNLGTIMYALSELKQVGRRGKVASEKKTSGGGDDGEGRNEISVEELQSSAAQYICCAQAMNSRPVYSSSLRLVRHALPLPALAAGSLLVVGTRRSCCFFFGSFCCYFCFRYFCFFFSQSELEF